ncbi:MAG: prepilin peptidase [Candidatus Nealsonbacteria bacterium]|nr:prepilin peptidase [Candidatus Nealsonbacteria bacterium]
MIKLGFSFLFFFLGLVSGSFLNSLIYRLETNQGFIRGRSFCPNCRHTLAWRDLLPIWSFLLLRGRCRYCQKPISWQYPLVEAATGLTFLLLFNQVLPHPFTFPVPLIYLVYLLFVSSCLIVIFVFDLKHYLIPDEIVYAGIAASLAYRLFEASGNWESLFNPLAVAFLTSLFFWLIYHFSHGQGLGFGDVKLGFLMGLLLAFPQVLAALFFAFFSGAIIGIGLLALKKKKLKSELPFAPFLVSGTFFALFFGERIVNYYLSLLV